jgi:ribosomal protein S27AE
MPEDTAERRPRTAQEDKEIDRGVSEIVCVECGTAPRLKSLNKNDGTQTMCDCDDIKKSMDSVPYELRVDDLPDDWVVIEGRSARQLASEVDAMIDAGAYECPRCGSDFGLAETVSCGDCGYVPKEARA